MIPGSSAASRRPVEPGRRVPLPAGRWAAWDQVILRAPGFPAAGLTALSSPAIGRAADAALDAPAGGSQEQDYRAVFEREILRVGTALQEVARGDRFRLALGWQNHRALATAVEPLLRRELGVDRRHSNHRQHEELIAGYWQRYCLKNDTIGFFGPVGWSRLDPHRPASTLTAGPGLISHFEVFFESWAMDRLATVIVAEPGMSTWLAPRRMPYVRLDGDRASLPNRPPIPLTELEAAILRSCDGVTPAAGVAAAVRAELPAGPDDAEVFDALHRLCRRRLASWKLELPLTPWPERYLDRALRQVGDPELARTQSERLARMLTAREAIRTAMVDAAPDRLVTAMRELDRVFVEETGAAATRHEGKAYAGRTLVYHDARRDVELVLGAEVYAALRPIETLLASARWLTYQVGRGVTGVLRDIASTIIDRNGGGPLDLSTFWFECMARLHQESARIADEVQAEFQRRWDTLLEHSPEQTTVTYTEAELADRVAQVFDAPRSGWGAARYCSPDVMIAAPDLASINRGEFTLVLGEVHLSLNSCRHHCFVTQHPAAEQLFDCVSADFPSPRLLPALPKENVGRLSVRTHSALTREEDYVVVLAHHTVDAARPRTLPAVDLTVEVEPDRVVAVLPDGGTRFDVLDLFSEILTDVVLDRFRILPERAHTPRITVDRMVIARETWRFDPHDLAFATVKDEAGLFLGARRWWRSTTLPQRVFVKVPGEDKPFHVDFDSPTSVRMLARSLRRLRTAEPQGKALVTITEMLPTPDQLWLVDADGNRYTSELRIAMVDLTGTDPAPPGAVS
ncbi:lantibiotic dehydratase [Micromonospora sp. NPDC023956]|uniref:lantibiotic dehydratase n=1 Tax=Micromonospora sp. NPDC023956 TaxID=3155722 RepID=UPI0033ECAE11